MFSDDMEFGYYDQAERKASKAFELYEDGCMSQALDALNTALEINPANSAWHFDKALALDSIHRFSEAIVEYELALELSPEDLEILNSAAVDYTRTGQYDRAIEVFEHIEQLDPDFEPGYCNRIIAYTEMGLHDQAEEMFYMAQQINSSCALCYYNIGNSLYVRGLYQKAIGCWVKTAELESSHPQIHYRIAQAYWYQGDAAKAREHFLYELRANPGDIDVIFDYGLFLQENNDTEAAREKFNRILELKPDYAPALFYLGEIAFNSHDYDRAVDMYDAALRYDKGLAGPYYRLAQYALMQNKAKKARTYLVSELRNCPENSGLLLSIGSMFLDISALSAPSSTSDKSSDNESNTCDSGLYMDLDHAMHCLLRAVDIDNTNPEIYYYLGLASAMRRDYEDAKEFFSHALDLKPDHVSALCDSARIFYEQGSYDKAIQRMSLAKECMPADYSIKLQILKIRIHQAINSAMGLIKK